MARAIRPTLGSAFLILAALLPTPARAQTAGKIRITVSKETTYITAPLNPDGTPNYIAAVNALCGKGVTPENNAAVVLVQALRQDVSFDPHRRAEIYRLLQIPPPPANGHTQPDVRDYAPSNPLQGLEATHLEMMRLLKLARAPWKAQDDPEVAAFIRAEAGVLDMGVSASRRKQWFLPFVPAAYRYPTLPSQGAVGTPLGWVGVDMGIELTVRAMLRVGQGKADMASADLQAVHRLAALMSRGAGVGSFSAPAVDVPASRAEGAMARSGKLTAPQLRRHLAALTAIPELDGANEFQQGMMRLLQLEQWICCARKSVREVFSPGIRYLECPIESLPDYPLDWDEALRMQNTYVDRVVAAEKLPTFRERAIALRDLEAEILKIAGSDKKAYAAKMVKLVKANRGRSPEKITRETFYYLEHCFGWRPEMFMTLQDNARAVRRLAVVSLALAIWRAEKGSYPDSLDALSPGVLEAVPADPFTDRPLVYRRAGEDYVLYSVGANMTDDGGADTSEKKGADDGGADTSEEKGPDDVRLDPRPE